jgi:NAD+-dependent secondary alcohol dehydrogenase Adh1
VAASGHGLSPRHPVHRWSSGAGAYQDLSELIALYERGLLQSHVVRYPLADAQRAFDDLEAGNVRGRAVLVP